MIEVRIGDLAESALEAVLRPVSSDWAAVTPAMRRLEIAAGLEVEEQCRRLGELPVGSAAITAAGALSSDYMIHVVVRSSDQPVSESTVRNALRNGLRRAKEWGVTRLAIAPLGTGAGNLDPARSAEVMIPLLVADLAGEPPLRVELVVESDYERDVFLAALRRHWPDGIGQESAEATGDRRR